MGKIIQFSRDSSARALDLPMDREPSEKYRPVKRKELGNSLAEKKDIEVLRQDIQRLQTYLEDTNQPKVTARSPMTGLTPLDMTTVGFYGYGFAWPHVELPLLNTNPSNTVPQTTSLSRIVKERMAVSIITAMSGGGLLTSAIVLSNLALAERVVLGGMALPALGTAVAIAWAAAKGDSYDRDTK